jgi:hypothetical protein
MDKEEMLGCYTPRKAIETRNTAGIALEDAEWSGRKEAIYLAKVDRPMPKKAPVMLRMVASKCWASVSWAEKTSSLSVRSKKAEGPPSRDQDLMTIRVQHIKVESKRARTRRVRKLETRLKMRAMQSARTKSKFFSTFKKKERSGGRAKNR